MLELLWVAPEHLPHTTFIGHPKSQKGDVYSFSIILEEIVGRGGPYEAAKQVTDIPGNLINLRTFLKCLFTLSISSHATLFLAIISRIIAHEVPPFRPSIGSHDCPPDLLELMEKCWADNPDDRPTFCTIRSMVRDIMKYVSSSVLISIKI